MQIELLYILGNINNYNKYSTILDKVNITDETYSLLQAIHKYYKRSDEPKNIDWDTFKTWYLTIYAVKTDPSIIILETVIIDRLIRGDIDSVLEKELIEMLIKRTIGERLVVKAFEVAEGGSGSLDEVWELKDEYDGLMASVSEKEEDPKEVLELALMETTGLAGSGLEWRMEGLNLALGPLQEKGDFIVIGGRPDAAKTSLMAYNCTHFASQLKDNEVIVWFNNEERGNKVRARLLQAATGLTMHEIRLDVQYAIEKYEGVIGDVARIQVIDIHGESIRGLASTLNRLRQKSMVRLIFFDQVWKIHIPHKGASRNMGSPNDAQGLSELAIWARTLASTTAPVITTIWADAQADGVRFVPMDRLHGSKTAIPGEADAIITIGRDNRPGFEAKRYICIPKNKMVGRDEKYRNGKWDVGITPETCQFTGPI